MLLGSRMSNTTSLSKKLSLSTETVRMLSASELDTVVGGNGDSIQSVCIGNGRTNDTRSAIGYCPTATATPRDDGKK